ncbi:MAG: histidine kinase [Bacteroidota bacterium]
MPRIVLHIGFWLIYLLLNAYVEVTLAGSTFNELAWWKRVGLGVGVELFFLPVKIGVTYLILYSLLPRLYRDSKAWWWAILLVLSVSVAAVLNLLVLYGVIYPLLYGEEINWARISSGRFIWSFIDTSSVVGIAIGIKYFRLRLASLEREKQLVEEKLQSELRFLRAQTNPHFLFNVLNSIYALARKKDDRTEETVLRLSKLLRFMIYECNAAFIPLEKEVQMIRDYLKLEEVRFQDKVELQFEESIDDTAYKIPPLLLLPLVENAFKHGVSESRTKGEVQINLVVQDGRLSFMVANSVETPVAVEANKDGLGLQNIRRQLSLLYPEVHQLEIEPTSQHFRVILTLNLQQS